MRDPIQLRRLASLYRDQALRLVNSAEDLEAEARDAERAALRQAMDDARVKVGDVVDVCYTIPATYSWEDADQRQYVDVTVAAIRPDHLAIAWDDPVDGHQYRTLRRDRIDYIVDAVTGDDLYLPRAEA